MKLIRIIPLLMILQSCFPSFSPEEKTIKKLKQNDTSLKWTKVIGILDQNFPDYIAIQVGKESDTICKAHNIADLKMKDDTIIIGFYGNPQQYKESIEIPNEMLGYKILIDTSFVSKDENP